MNDDLSRYEALLKPGDPYDEYEQSLLSRETFDSVREEVRWAILGLQHQVCIRTLAVPLPAAALPTYDEYRKMIIGPEDFRGLGQDLKEAVTAAQFRIKGDALAFAEQRDHA